MESVYIILIIFIIIVIIISLLFYYYINKIKQDNDQLKKIIDLTVKDKIEENINNINFVKEKLIEDYTNILNVKKQELDGKLNENFLKLDDFFNKIFI